MKPKEAAIKSIDDLIKDLSSERKGLSSSEVLTRRQQYGFNEITERIVNPAIKFLAYFWGPIPWMIEVAALLSAGLGRWDDFAIIFVLLLMNGAVGFWQENKAGRAIELLKKRLAPKARVLRDGKWIDIPARELVPGDIVHIRLGTIVPADIKLVEGEYLEVDESALTGESLPVEKHMGDVACSGSIVRLGEMNGLVFGTGMDTYFGLTAKLVEESETRSHFQQAVIKIGYYLIVLAVSLVTLVIIAAVIRQESLLQTLQFALVLLVAAIPAALPAILSVTMAVGAIEMAKKDAIVSKLASIDEMAGIDVLCSDKTGTITQNAISVADVVPFDGFSAKDVLLYGLMASREESDDVIDNAIIERSKELQYFGDYKVIDFKPFDPVIKRTEATIDSNGRFQVVKGAAQAILALTADRA